MLIEEQLRERLKKVEALYFGATTAGERDAAEAAAERLKAKLEEGLPPRSRRRDEVQLAGPMVGPIAHRLVAGVMAFGRSDIRGSARRRSWSGRRAAFFDTVVWRQFSDLHTDPLALFRADDGAADPGGYPRRYCGRRDRSRARQPAMTRIMPPSQFVRVRHSNSTPEDRAARRCRFDPT